MLKNSPKNNPHRADHIHTHIVKVTFKSIAYPKESIVCSTYLHHRNIEVNSEVIFIKPFIISFLIETSPRNLQ